MTEFARTPRALQRLFQTIDFAPLPQHAIIAQSLLAWRRARGKSLVPSRVQVGKEQGYAAISSSLVASLQPSDSDFLLRSIGENFSTAAGLDTGARHLANLDEARIAVRLRRLFRLALEYGEPLVVHFCEKGQSYEVLAAPIALDDGSPGIWCTLAGQDLRSGRGS